MRFGCVASCLKPVYAAQEKPEPGAQPADGMLGIPVEEWLELTVPQTDKILAALLAAHLGHCLGDSSWPRLSSSNTCPHWGQAYSNMGMKAPPDACDGQQMWLEWERDRLNTAL